MSMRRCSTCYYGDACTGDGSCPFYDPIVVLDEDEEMNTYIENRRAAYYEEVCGGLQKALLTDDFFDVEL